LLQGLHVQRGEAAVAEFVSWPVADVGPHPNAQTIRLAAPAGWLARGWSAGTKALAAAEPDAAPSGWGPGECAEPATLALPWLAILTRG
jgi:hypothetical protein